MNTSTVYQTPHFHQEMYVHYAQLYDQAYLEQTANPIRLQLIMDQLDHHMDQYNRLVELHILAKEFGLTLKEMTHLQNLAAKFDGSNCEFDHQRILLSDEAGTILAWHKFPQLSTPKITGND